MMMTDDFIKWLNDLNNRYHRGNTKDIIELILEKAIETTKIKKIKCDKCDSSGYLFLEKSATIKKE